MNFLSAYSDKITQLCRTYDVKSLSAFGSVLTERFSSESDVDFIVDFRTKDPITYAENYFQLKFQLETILKRHIDLLEEKSIHNPYLRGHIDKHKVGLYEN